MNVMPKKSMIDEQWVRADAIFLKENGRLQSSLLLLLCLVDAQANEVFPIERSNRSRYCGYLRTRLAELGHDASYRIEEKDTLLHLSEIIYEYFRCYIVHEGNSRADPQYEIQLKYEPNPRSVFGAGVLIDRPNKQIVFQAGWLINLLLDVCAKTARA